MRTPLPTPDQLKEAPGTHVTVAAMPLCREPQVASDFSRYRFQNARWRQGRLGHARVNSEGHQWIERMHRRGFRVASPNSADALSTCFATSYAGIIAFMAVATEGS